MSRDTHNDDYVWSDGRMTPTVEAYIYFDEPPPTEAAPQVDVLQAMLAVTFQLGQWAGTDPVKTYAAQVVMRQTAQGVRAFSREARVSDSYVRRMIREAKEVVGFRNTAL